MASTEQNDKQKLDTTVIRTPECSSVTHAVLAIFLWLGAIHFMAFIIFASLLFLPVRGFFLVLGFLVTLMVIPVDEQSKLGKRLARYISKHMPRYFPVTLHLEDIKAFDPNQSYVIGYEPHSIMPVGVAALCDLGGLIPLTKVKGLASSAIFHTPFMRHIWTWLGIVPATRKNFISYLNAGYSCVIVPGGVAEVIYMQNDSETSVFKWWRLEGKLVLQISKVLKFAPVLFWGAFGSPIPYRKPVHVVVGRPIEIKKIPQPTLEEVNEVHNQFIEALRDIFENHKARVGYADLQLRIL